MKSTLLSNSKRRPARIRVDMLVPEAVELLDAFAKVELTMTEARLQRLLDDEVIKYENSRPNVVL